MSTPGIHSRDDVSGAVLLVMAARPPTTPSGAAEHNCAGVIIMKHDTVTIRGRLSGIVVLLESIIGVAMAPW